MSRKPLLLAFAALAVCGLSIPAASAAPAKQAVSPAISPTGTPAPLRASAPGVTRRNVTIGSTFPISGPASLYAPIATGMQAYFSYINARRARDGTRGVYGRQIIFRVYDDQYNPAQTVQLTRRLVEQDRVFALVGGLGTEPQTPVRPYLNQRRVPQLYVSTGATTWGADHRRFPWTIGWQPDYQAEGRAYGRFIRQNSPAARVAILRQNDDYGNDYLRGFREGLANRTNMIVADEAFEVTSPSVAPNIQRLAASRADTFLILATPRATIQALVVAHRAGWRPRLYVNSVSATESFLRQAAAAAGSDDAVNGVVSVAYLKDPAAAQYQRDPQVVLYKRLMARYAPGRNVNDGLFFYGMAKADSFVQALYRAGRNPTRQSLMNAAVNMRWRSPWLLPGTEMRSSRSNPFPISTMRMTRYNNGNFAEFGPLLRTR